MTDPVLLIVSALVATTAAVFKNVSRSQAGTSGGGDIGEVFIDCIKDLSINVVANCLHGILGIGPDFAKIAEGNDFIRVQRVALRACIALAPPPAGSTLVARWRWRRAAHKLARYAAQNWPRFDQHQRHWEIVRAKDPEALLRDFAADRERSRAATVAAWEDFLGAAGSPANVPNGLRQRAAERIWQHFPQQFFNALAHDQPAHNKAVTLGQHVLRAEVTTIPVAIAAVHGPQLRDDPRLDPSPSYAKGDHVSIADLHYTARWLPHLLFREPAIVELTSFLRDSETYLWWGVIGEGGVGKSRIGLELIAIARAAGWTAGFLDRVGSEGICSFPERLDLWQPVGNTLIVVDYASFHRTDLPRTLRLFAQARPRFDGRIRVLLLDRPGSLSSVFAEDGAWGTGAEGRTNTLALRFCARACRETEPEARFNETRDLLTLSPLTEAHWPAFLHAVVERAGHAGLKIEDTPSALEKIARATGGGRPLLLTIYGLALVRPGADASTRFSMDALLDEALREEVMHRWNPLLWGRTSATEPHRLLPAFQRAVAFITLCRGFTVNGNMSTLRTAAGTSESDDEFLYAKLQRLLVRPLSGERKGELPPLEPDLLAERFLLLGGISLKKDAASPFHADTLMSLAATYAPMGLAEILCLIFFDYKSAAAPLFVTAIPHFSLVGVTRDGTSRGDLLPYQNVTHPILSIWKTVGVAALFPPEMPEMDLFGIATPLWEWGKLSLAHRYVSFLGIIELAQKIPKGHLLAYVFAHEFVPPFPDLPPLFAQLVAGGATHAVRALAAAGAWPEVEEWVDQLRGVASAYAADQEVQVWFARSATILISAHAAAGKRSKMEEWENELRGVASAHSANKEIQTWLAKGAVFAIINAAPASEWTRVEEWTQVLRAAMPDQLTRTGDIQAWEHIYRLLTVIFDKTPHVLIGRLIAEIRERFWERDFGENGSPAQILTNAVRLVTMFDTSPPKIQEQIKQMVESGGFSMGQLRLLAKAGEQS